MKKICYYATAVGFMAMPLIGCGSDEVTINEPSEVKINSDGKKNNGENNNGNQTKNNDNVTSTRNIELTDAQKKEVEKNNDFAFNFYRQLIKLPEVEGKNNIASPLSVTYAIGMLNDGAKGKTSEEMISMLGFDNGTATDINELCQQLINEAPKIDELVVLKLADCIVTHLGTELAEKYQKNMRDYYQAEVFCKDFSQASTIKFINDWCDQHTEGTIKEIIGKLDPEAKIVLMNAIYFKAAWSGKFKKEDTKDESFTNEKGGSCIVSMMRRIDATEFTENNVYSTISLPYGSGSNWRMYVLLPKVGRTVNDVLNGLNNASWNDNVAKMKGMVVDVKLPKFKIESDMELNDVLRALGASSMFGMYADFSLMTKDPCQLFVSLIKQKATIEVSEEGTEASAVTITLETSSSGDGNGGMQIPQFYANRPFIYLIQEASSGAVFFIGTYQGN